MKRIIAYFSLFILVMAVSVLAHLPAPFALSYMPPVRGLDIQGVSGTIWHGDARSVSWQGQNLGQVSWSFIPAKLISAKAEYALRFGRGSSMKLRGKGAAGISLDGLYAENVHASLPAKVAERYIQAPVPLQLSGSVDLTINRFLYAQPWCQSAQGALVWNSSEVATPLGELKLGTIIADIGCEQNRLTASGDHQSDPASGAFSAELEPDRRYKLDAWFKPGAALPAAMKSQLKWLGDPDGKGRYPFVFSGRL